MDTHNEAGVLRGGRLIGSQMEYLSEIELALQQLDVFQSSADMQALKDIQVSRTPARIAFRN